jgi:hypothetical protein
MAVSMWEVSGGFVIPGTRDRGTFGPVKVIALSRQKASADLAPLLQEKFRKEARGTDNRPYKFSDHFALMHLGWRELPSAKEKTENPPPASVIATEAIASGAVA